jgi:hypothetical protein
MESYNTKNIVWIADNIFIDMEMMSDYPLKTVIHSIPFEIDGLDGVDARIYYPSAMAANYLNDRYGAKGKIVATLLLGADDVHF